MVEGYSPVIQQHSFLREEPPPYYPLYRYVRLRSGPLLLLYALTGLRRGLDICSALPTFHLCGHYGRLLRL